MMKIKKRVSRFFETPSFYYIANKYLLLNQFYYGMVSVNI